LGRIEVGSLTAITKSAARSIESGKRRKSAPTTFTNVHGRSHGLISPRYPKVALGEASRKGVSPRPDLLEPRLGPITRSPGRRDRSELCTSSRKLPANVVSEDFATATQSSILFRSKLSYFGEWRLLGAIGAASVAPLACGPPQCDKRVISASPKATSTRAGKRAEISRLCRQSTQNYGRPFRALGNPSAV